MKHRNSFVVAFILSFFLILATAGVASAVPTAKASAVAGAETQAVSGTVTSVSDTSLVVNSEGKEVTFELRPDTQIEGKVAQGAKVTVEYRVEEGKNIAVRVTVSASS